MDRIYKSFMCFIVVPIIWIMLFMIACIVIALPLYALVCPDKITLESEQDKDNG